MIFPCAPGLQTEPFEVLAGDTLTWTRNFANFPATDGWVLTYVLNSPTARFLVASGDVVAAGEDFAITIPSTETKAWLPGRYDLVAVLTLVSTRRTFHICKLKVDADILDATSPQDTRSVNEIALWNIDEMLAKRGGDGVQEYTIAGRMLRRYSLPDLLKLRSHYAGLVRQERADSGEKQRSRIVAVHFG